MLMLKLRAQLIRASAVIALALVIAAFVGRHVHGQDLMEYCPACMAYVPVHVIVIGDAMFYICTICLLGW